VIRTSGDHPTWWYRRRRSVTSWGAGSRAKTCATALIADTRERGRVVAELEHLAEAPPDPKPIDRKSTRLNSSH
jgi:hypothetical protein